jgi:hypothetical protein
VPFHHRVLYNALADLWILLLLLQVPEYVLSRLQRVSDETDPRKRRRLAKLLALLAALLQLAAARNRLPLKPPRVAKVGAHRFVAARW